VSGGPPPASQADDALLASVLRKLCADPETYFLVTGPNGRGSEVSIEAQYVPVTPEEHGALTRMPRASWPQGDAP
jgi:hypothetical protein